MTATRFHIRSALRSRVTSVVRARLALVVAPAGSGKTTLLEAWREDLLADGHAVAWLGAGARHEAPAVFVEEAVEAIRGALGSEAEHAFERLLDALPHLDEADPDSLARHLLRDLRRLDAPFWLFLDDYQALPRDGATARLIDILLREGPEMLHWVCASRGARPASASRLLAADVAIDVDAEELSLRGEQVAEALAESGIESESLSLLLLAETGGWATGVQLACRALARIAPEERERFVRMLGEHADLFDYVASEIVSGESERTQLLLSTSAILGPSSEALLLEAMGEDAGFDLIESTLEKGLLLRQAPGVGVHPLWQRFLLRRLRLRSTPGEWSERHARLARLVEHFDPARALEIARAGEASTIIADLLAAHGRAWLERGRYATVEAALQECEVDETSVQQAYLHALITARRQPEEGTAQLEAVADRYRKQGDWAEEGFALLDAFIVATNANLAASVRRLLRRLLSLRRLARDPQVRALSLVMLSALALSRGRATLSARILKRVRLHGLSPTIQGAATVGLTIFGRYRDWDETLRVLDEALADRDRTGHAPAFYLCQATHALLVGLRADPASTEFAEALDASRDAASAVADFRIAMSELVCCDALGKLEVRAGNIEQGIAAFERGAALAEACSEVALESALRAQLALLHRERGDAKAAIAQAERAADLLEVRSPEVNPITIRFPAALALRALAECGNPERAHALLTSQERSFRSPFPIANHQTALILARVESLAGFEDRARKRLDQANALAERLGLRDVGTEVDAELLAWSVSSTNTSNACEIRTLGGIEVIRDGEPVSRNAWRGITTRRLLARILAGGGVVRRELLQVDLWPDAEPKRAGGSLRVALTRLRAVLGKEALLSDSEEVRLNDDLYRDWDVNRFRRECETQGDALALLERYPGPFAPELYDDWADALRGELQARFVREALRRVDQAALDGDLATAAQAGERLVGLEPLEAEAWRAWARAAAALEGEPAAERILARGRETLERELGEGSVQGLTLEALRASGSSR